MVVYWKEEERVTCQIDEERKNRYSLTCTWDERLPIVSFIMLNPSVGRQDYADPTLRRCVNFARSWGFGSMIVVNLFSYITPFPKELKENSPTTMEKTLNDKQIKKAIDKSEKVIMAWGEKGSIYKERVEAVINMIPENKKFVISKTKHDIPRHPLFLRNDLVPIKFIN